MPVTNDNDMPVSVPKVFDHTLFRNTVITACLQAKPPRDVYEAISNNAQIIVEKTQESQRMDDTDLIFCISQMAENLVWGEKNHRAIYLDLLKQAEARLPVAGEVVLDQLQSQLGGHADDIINDLRARLRLTTGFVSPSRDVIPTIRVVAGHFPGFVVG
jgi:hypothetical protein